MSVARRTPSRMGTISILGAATAAAASSHNREIRLRVILGQLTTRGLVSTSPTTCAPAMVDAKLVQHRRMQVGHAHLLVDECRPQRSPKCDGRSPEMIAPTGRGLALSH